MKTTSPHEEKKEPVFYISLTATASGTVYVRETKILWHRQLLSPTLPMVAGEESLQQSGLLLLCVCWSVRVRDWDGWAFCVWLDV